ncbi:MAG: hypothetical protein EPO36_11775 [Chloroflexota bacterium]|nr:MAG: hypothetical protein EPO36_11775 [Chloroflexota bacterium]
MRPEKPDSWDAVLSTHAGTVVSAARALEALIRAEAPGLEVRFDPGTGLLAFGWSMRMRDLVFALIPHAGWVNLQLADGAILPDSGGLVEGTGKRIRHVKVRSAEAAAAPAVRDLVRAQLEVRPREA